MTQENDDSDLLPLVAVGATLVATGTALSSSQPLLGLVIIVGAVTLLVFALVRMVQRQEGQNEGRKPRRSSVWVAVLVLGMMLSGGGAALTAVNDPVIGLGIALGGGVLCGVGGWRMIIEANGRG
jgi:NADH:ubiquinone oxidoreductase subunit 6 (subunit J)